jgi:cytochrome b involved in lipid metabolism
VASHGTVADCWVIVDGGVYDVTKFLTEHPGGRAALSKPGRGGCDVSSHFHRIGHSDVAKDRLQALLIGRVLTDDAGHPSLVEEAPGVDSGSIGAVDSGGIGAVDSEPTPWLDARPEIHRSLCTRVIVTEEGGVALRDDDKEEYALEWHGERRGCILRAHPEVAELYGACLR